MSIDLVFDNTPLSHFAGVGSSYPDSMVEPAADTPAGVLVDEALGLDHESHEYWKVVYELQRRGDQQTFTLAARLAEAAETRARRLGLNVLAQLGFSEGRPFLDASLPVVLLAAEDPDRDVRIAAISALGHLADARGLPAVLNQRSHEDERVRFGVAIALPAVAGDPPADEAVRALVELMEDTDAGVRDWATFGLGTQLEIDSPMVRDALAARLDDPDDDTVREALAGLAVRRDPRAADRLLQLLDDPRCDDSTVEAATAFGSPLLLSPLLRLRDLGWAQDDRHGESLERAIEACSPKA